MFDTLIVQPIFNLLVAIYALLPGHNFGLAIIVLTIIVRLLMWPLVKKQMHQTKAMRKLQPELKRIKAETKGDKARQQMLMMELYKERNINPLATFGILLVQLPIFLALYSGLNRIVNDKQAIIDFSYPFVRNLPSIQELAADMSKFDNTLFGVVDLARPALGDGGLYVPAMLIVVASAVMQYFQSKQLMPDDKDGRNLRSILRDAKTGQEANQEEVNAAIGRSTRYMLPALILFITIGIASAISLYWFVSGAVAYLQQARLLGRDEDEMEAIASAPTKGNVIEGEVIAPATPTKTKKKKSAKSKSSKRRKR